MFTLRILPDLFGVLKLPVRQPWPSWLSDRSVFFVAKTEDEFSIMCPQHHIPAHQACSRNWRCIRVDGDLAFDQVGVAASIANPLAEREISIILVGTHDRDYVLFQQEHMPQVIEAYESVGFQLNGLD